MKYLSTLRNKLRANRLNDKRGQGATEYILLLVVVVGMIVAFGPKIKKAVEDKTGKLAESMDEVK